MVNFAHSVVEKPVGLVNFRLEHCRAEGSLRTPPVAQVVPEIVLLSRCWLALEKNYKAAFCSGSIP